MDILQMASQLMAEKLGGNVSAESASTAISDLLGDGKGNIDLGNIVSQLGSKGGLGSIVQSWLGDGDNQAIGAAQVMEMFDANKLNQFAEKLGVSPDQAVNGLSDILPAIIDKSSSGGNLLENLGGVGGLLGAAKGFFK